MRLDKWLKLSRLIKRRTIASKACQQGRVYINERIAKPGCLVAVGDKVHLELGNYALSVIVQQVPDKAPSIQEATKLYQVIEEIRRTDNL